LTDLQIASAMLSAMSSLDWDSSWSPAFASEVPHGSQLASYLDPSEQGIIGSPPESYDDHIPSIDESVFDLLDSHVSPPLEVVPNFDEDFGLHKWEEIPDLEEVLYMSSPASAQSSPARLHFDYCSEDEVPPLEEFEDTSLVDQSEFTTPVRSLHNQPSWSSPEHVSSGCESPIGSETGSSPLMFEEVVEEVIYTPCNAVEILVYSPASAISSECGSVSPASSLTEERIDLLQIPEKRSQKRRRTSQLSVASSSGISSFDEREISTSDFHDVDDSPPRKKKGGRRARFTAEDRKERKKEQNRTAAERYRFKRKMQEEVVGDEEQNLLDENATLKTDVAKLEAEVSCLKTLMRDMLKAKGMKFLPRK